MRRKNSQLELQYPNTWGGRRKGAGRPRSTRPTRKRSVPHITRPTLASRFPVHVTLTVLACLPRLRGFAVAKTLRKAFVSACGARGSAAEGRGFRICQFSIQGNHIHLICEAKTQTALSRGVQGFKIRVTRALNSHWGARTGTVWADRFHQEIMKSPRQVRNGICYVMQNARRHGERLPAWAAGVDPFSSAWYFHGWRDNKWRSGVSPPRPDPDLPGNPVADARTWLLTVGWRRHGLIATKEVPAAARLNPNARA